MTNSAEHHELQALLGAFALDALEGVERHAVEAHLRGCDACQAELVELRRVMAGLGLAAGEQPPPPALRDRVLTAATGRRVERRRAPASFAPRTRGRRASDHVQVEEVARSSTPVWRLAGAAAILLAVVAGVYAVLMRNQMEDMKSVVSNAADRSTQLAAELEATRRDSSRLTRIVEVLSAPDLMRVELRGRPEAPAASGRAFLSMTRGLVFSANKLPALSPGRVYQLWVIAGGAPVSVGILTPAADGVATMTVALPSAMASPSAVAVTAEPGPDGSKTPTMPILLMGEMKPL